MIVTWSKFANAWALKVEWPENIREMIGMWNIRVAEWLRLCMALSFGSSFAADELPALSIGPVALVAHILCVLLGLDVYMRAPKFLDPTWLTFAVSAFWHVRVSCIPIYCCSSVSSYFLSCPPFAHRDSILGTTTSSSTEL
jgi:hypothetical protein